jgi:hypothetical protein
MALLVKAGDLGDFDGRIRCSRWLVLVDGGGEFFLEPLFDLPAAQQFLLQRVHVQVADLLLNVLRSVALLQDFQNLQS